MIGDLVKEYWAQAVAFVGFVIWLERVAAQGKTNASEIRSLWRQRNEDLESHRRARDETNEVLAEMRSDIKTLLARGGK